MNEEEKKAIKIINDYIERKRATRTVFNTEDIIFDNIIILLGLLEKQQKEIEEKNVAINKMSKDISRQLKEIEKLNFENHMIKKWNEQLDRNCISKDKIRDILNYLDNTSLNNYEIVMAFKKIMKELLEDDGDHIPKID